MKKLKKFCAVMAVATISLFGSSCDPEPEECDGFDSFIEYHTSDGFYDIYASYGKSKALIDLRDASSYAADHLTGAVNLPATIGNPDNINSQWCKDLVAMFPDKNTCLFFYGATTTDIIIAVGNNASRVGYTKANSRICAKEFEELKEAWEAVGPFIEYSNAETYYETYASYTGAKALIDTRDSSSFAAGHLEGAVNFPATIYNTDSNDAQWCKDLLAAYPTSTCLFFYGQTSFQMIKTVAGRASKIGYGEQNSRICSNNYVALKAVWK